MKKSVLLLMATFLFAFYTKANNSPKCPDLKFEAKAQFVKWKTVPSYTEVAPIWVKNALQGKNFKDAVVNPNATAAYKKVLGESLYNKILAGDDTRFKMGKSKGNEINWGIDSDGQPVKMEGTLGKDLWIIYFDDQPIAKWGTNGCLNALSSPPAFVDDGEDPDNQKEEVVTKKTQKEEFLKLTGGSNTNQYMLNMTSGQVQSSNEQLLLGMAIRENHMLVDFAVAKDLINSKQCCNNNTGGMTQMNTVAPAPNMYYMASAPQMAPQMASYPTNGNLNVTVKQKRDFVDYANLVFHGAEAVSDVKNAFWGFDINNRNTGNYNNGGGSTNPTIRGFQGSGSLGYSSTGNGSSGNTGNGGLIYNNQF